MVFGGIFSLSLRRSLLGCTRQGDADQGTGELGDVAGVLTVLVDGNAARSGTKGEGSAGAGGDTCDEGEAAAASDLAGSRDAHLEGVAQGVVIRGGVLGEGGVTGESLAYAGPAVGDGDQDLFASPSRAGFVAGHAVVTVSWVVVALVLLARGVRRPALRVAGLVLVAAAVAKLLLFDLVALDGLARVAAFLGAGLLLLAAGTRYARLIAEAEDAETEHEPAPRP